MPNLSSPTGAMARTPTRARRDRQKLLRWATLGVLLLLAAVAVSRT